MIRNYRKYSAADSYIVGFTFEKNLILILENGTNSLWLIELDKKTGGNENAYEPERKKRTRNCRKRDASPEMQRM